MGLEIFNILADHFERAAEKAERNPGTGPWDQASWGFININAAKRLFGNGRTPTRAEIVNECGTHACIAGWTVLYAGDPSRIQFERMFHTTDDDDAAYRLVVTHGDSLRDYAAELLELDDLTADGLFDALWRPAGFDPDLDDNHPDNLRALAAQLRTFAENGLPSPQVLRQQWVG